MRWNRLENIGGRKQRQEMEKRNEVKNKEEAKEREERGKE